MTVRAWAPPSSCSQPAPLTGRAWQGELLDVLLAGGAASLVLAACLVGSAALIAVLSQGRGLNFLGIALLLGAMLWLVSTATAGLAGFAFLRWRGVKRPLAVGLAGAAWESAILFAAIWGTGALTSVLDWGVGLLAIGLITFVGAWALFSRSGLPLAVSIGVAVLAPMTASAAGHQMAAFFVRQHAQAGSRQAVAALPFTAYLPSVLPGGYRTADSELVNPYTSPPTLSEVYVVGANDLGAPPPITLTEFQAQASFNPPTDCGDNFAPDAALSEVPTPCIQVGQTSTGVDVWFQNRIGPEVFYAKVGSTVVTIEFEGPPGPTPADVVAMLSSLAPLSSKRG